MKRIITVTVNGVKHESVNRGEAAKLCGTSVFKLDRDFLLPLPEGTDTTVEVDKGIVLEVKWAEGGAVRKAKDPNAPKKEKKAKDPNAPKKERKAKAKNPNAPKKERKAKAKKAPKEGAKGTVYVVERNCFDESKEFDDITSALTFFEEGKDIEDVNETSIYIQEPGKPVEEQDSWTREPNAEVLTA